MHLMLVLIHTCAKPHESALDSQSLWSSQVTLPSFPSACGSFTSGLHAALSEARPEMTRMDDQDGECLQISSLWKLENISYVILLFINLSQWSITFWHFGFGLHVSFFLWKQRTDALRCKIRIVPCGYVLSRSFWIVPWKVPFLPCEVLQWSPQKRGKHECPASFFILFHPLHLSIFSWKRHEKLWISLEFVFLGNSWLRSLWHSSVHAAFVLTQNLDLHSFTIRPNQPWGSIAGRNSIAGGWTLNSGRFTRICFQQSPIFKTQTSQTSGHQDSCNVYTCGCIHEGKNLLPSFLSHDLVGSQCRTPNRQNISTIARS